MNSVLKQTEEKHVCPLANPIVSCSEGAYTEIISLARQFRAIGAAPHPDVVLPDEESMQQNRAAWHKTCRKLNQQHLTMQKNIILKDCFLPQEDPAGLVHLLIVICTTHNKIGILLFT